MWQKIQEDVGGDTFTIVAVALDGTREAARPWIEAAKPTYPALIDTQHHLADLYGMVNVPEAVWIDAAGRIVRPPEPAGAFEGFRKMDRATFKVPDEVVAKTAAARQTYYAAVRDWAQKGSASVHVLDADAARGRLKAAGPEVGEAHARFRLGLALRQAGRDAEAVRVLAEASRLHPSSWAIWRQAAPLDHRGLATGEAFWARVDALGAERYYPKVNLAGMP